ncbi:uncharacterized protein LOC107261812 [Ricinus communis]|uniref:uncharacterized protein LOC107261812 n=1 Tax=Ricinus communis TaxID=3988 RepID=UPI0007724A5E|nr:uncharacterized protein LOC107261812 [Ricinus communis]|eukprot:XP_015579087.1 uncharacterized protein LOC107261812 [Ricinus communis]
MGKGCTDSKLKVAYIGYIEVVPKNYGGNSKASFCNIAPKQCNSHQRTTANYGGNSKASYKTVDPGQSNSHQGTTKNHGGNSKSSYSNIAPRQSNSNQGPTKNYGGNSKPSYKGIAPSQSSSHEWTTKNSIVNKQTGGYMRTTMKESSSTGDVFKGRFTGRVGYKDEYKTTSSFRVGDKNGYFEYQKEERFRRVDYGKGSGSREKSSNSSSNKYLK